MLGWCKCPYDLLQTSIHVEMYHLLETNELVRIRVEHTLACITKQVIHFIQAILVHTDVCLHAVNVWTKTELPLWNTPARPGSEEFLSECVNATT